MGVESNCKEIIRQLASFSDTLETGIVPFLEKAGAMAVGIAKTSKTYRDKTGNLTASIGYGVVKDGHILCSGGFGSGEGGEAGRRYLEQKSSEIGDGIVDVIIVAGMEYASYVERSGYVVLDGSRLRLETIVNDLLSKMKIKL
ncbi:MAG: HK97 gp10 family phage protein [Paludibacteraceae bacterium]